MRHHWKPKDTWSHWLPWNALHSLCVSPQGWPLKRRCPYSCHVSNILTPLLISPRPNPTKTVKKSGPFSVRGSPVFPKNESTIQSSSQPKIFSIHQSQYPAVADHLTLKWFSVSIYQMEEKWPILLQNKRRHFSEWESEGEGNKPFLASVCAKKLF